MENGINPILAHELDEVTRLLSRNNSDDYFTEHSRVYPWTNENLKFVFDEFYGGEETVLTVSGSGDQAINAAMYGAKNIDVFDINQFALYYFDLKMAAMFALDFPEFIDFMPLLIHKNYPSENCLNWESYPQVTSMLKDISSRSHEFWKKALYRKRYDYINDMVRMFFMGMSDTEDAAKAIAAANYLTPDSYELARNNLIGARIHSQLLDLKVVPAFYDNRKYGFIYFSNIVQYATQAFPNEKNSYHHSLIAYKNFLENEVKPMLRKQGTIIANYCFYSPRDMKAKNQKIMKTVLEYDKRYMREIVPGTNDMERIIAVRG